MLYARARGLTWAAPIAILITLLGAAGAAWLESRPYFDGPLARIPAVTIAALGVAILAAMTLHRADDEVEGSTPRPTPATELIIVLAVVAVCAVLAAATIRSHPLQRGGIEMVRNMTGLTGLALIGTAIAGSRLGWLLPFTVTAISYFAVTRSYNSNPEQAAIGWLMFPATWRVTFVVAIALLAAGVAMHRLAGGIPRPRHHPLR